MGTVSGGTYTKSVQFTSFGLLAGRKQGPAAPSPAGLRRTRQAVTSRWLDLGCTDAVQTRHYDAVLACGMGWLSFLTLGRA